jgi:hypothetical protein
LGKDEENDFSYNLFLRENAIGKYEVYLNTFMKKERKNVWVKMDVGDNLIEAVQIADAKINKSFSNRFGLIKRNSPWRSQKPTEKQIEMLGKMKVHNNILSQLNKGQASFLLDKLWSDRPKKELSAKQRNFLRWKGHF